MNVYALPPPFFCDYYNDTKKIIKTKTPRQACYARNIEFI